MRTYKELKLKISKYYAICVTAFGDDLLVKELDLLYKKGWDLISYSQSPHEGWCDIYHFKRRDHI